MLNGQEEFEQRMSHLHLLKKYAKDSKIYPRWPLSRWPLKPPSSPTAAAAPMMSGPRQHSHIQFFLLLYPNSKARKDMRDHFSTLGPSFYREKTELKESNLPKNSWNFQAGLEVYVGPIIVTLSSYQTD